MKTESITLVAFLTILMSVDMSASAQEADTAEEAKTTVTQPEEKGSLQDDALAISGRYTRFARLLSQMADLLSREDPERAELLRRAISQSRENAIGTNIEAIAALLADQSLGDAIDKQKTSADAMKALLKLLQSEDRRSAIERERERLDGILKDVRNAIAEQRAARAAAQNMNAPSNAAPQQNKAMKRTDGVLDSIREHDDAKNGEQMSDSKDSDGNSDPKDHQDGADSEAGSNDTDSKDSESGKSGDGEEKEDSTSAKDGSDKKGESEKSKDGQPGDKSGDENKQGDNKDAEASGKDSKPSDTKSGDNESEKSDNRSQSPGGESKASDSKSESQNQSSSGNESKSPKPNQEQTPGREQLEQALNLMQEALEQLKNQEREKAVDNQDDAIAKLETAAKELEEKLKQQREEEKEMILAALEARFQRMLALQTQIYENTLDLAQVPKEKWLDTTKSECRELAGQQAELTLSCAQVTALLLEDGTSVSILVACEDIEADMGGISERLLQTKVSAFTQTMETDVIDALKELIEATQKEMQEMKSEERQQQQQQAKQDKPSLVDLMAEIRVLKSLQLRVNRRTRQINDLLQAADEPDTEDLNSQLNNLAHRQDRLRESAIELAKKMQRR